MNKHTVPSARRTGEMRRAPRKSGRDRVRAQWHASNQPDTHRPTVGRKSRIHSVLTALPILMVLIGLYVYFQAEKREAEGEPVLAEQQAFDAAFMRQSTVGADDTGQHYLWVNDGTRERGIRLDALQKFTLLALPAEEALTPGDAIHIEAAPHVAGSRTLWLLRLRRGERWVLE